MSNPNYSKLLFGLTLSLLTTTLALGQHINIKVYNKTGYEIDSVTFDQIQLGNLKKDTVVFIYSINELTMQGDVPLNRPFGIIEGKKRPTQLKPCSTKSKKKKTGAYAFDICLYETDSYYRLYWKKH